LKATKNYKGKNMLYWEIK